VVDQSATVAQAPVITVIIDSANADGLSAPFELVEAATKSDPGKREHPNRGEADARSRQ